MIQLPERHLGYLLIQCADEERGESLNVGVIVYDPHRMDVRCRVTHSLSRIERTLPNVPVSHVRVLLDDAESFVTEALESRGVDGLAALSKNARGTVRFTALRSIVSRHIDQTARELLERFVEMPDGGQALVARSAASFDPAGSQFSSRRVISSIETRLRRMKLTVGKDYTPNVTLFSETEEKLRLPVWFPLRLKGNVYVDGLEIKTEINRTLDGSRAIAQKVIEAHRAEPDSRISVIIRDPQMGNDGRLAEAIISEAVSHSDRFLEVGRYARPEQLDGLVEETVQLRL
jgi:hypothetical protein